MERASASVRIDIRLLGGFELSTGSRRFSTGGWRLRKGADLVKILALQPSHRLHREQLIDLLWPDKDPEAGANNLYQAIHAVRAAIPLPGVIAVRARLVQLGSDPPIDGAAESGTPAKMLKVGVDVDEFEEAVRDGRGRVERLEHARALYRGELLPDDPYAEWAVARREDLRAKQLSVLRDLAAWYERTGRADEAMALVREALRIEPLDEDLQRRLMRYEGQAGNRGAVARRFRALAADLRDELDVRPAPETVETFREALRRDIRPREIPTNVPPSLTSFIGRSRELADVIQSLQTNRLVTLTGTGGTGKTRLALEAARASRADYPDGVWLVELASVQDGALVTRAVADALAIRELPGSPLMERIVSLLADRHLLIVLDNCEHLVDAAATVADALLRGAGAVSILATSRQSLRAPGEVLFRVPSLAVADPGGDMIDFDHPPDAVTLFLERARAVDPQFALNTANAHDVARLCYHLDGLPLAVELAAARVGSLAVSTLVERLDQRFSLLVAGNRTALTRHQTLEATIDWSYQLLGEEGRRVLRSLSVLPAGAAPDAVEAVCAPDDRQPETILATVADLVDQSLVMHDQTDQPRYRMLETVREFARERAVRAGETDELERRFVAWALRIAGQDASAGVDATWQEHFRRIERENDNLRVAIEKALGSAPEIALAIAEALWPFWLWDGDLAEGRRWLTRALDAAPENAPLRARAILGLGALTGRSGDPRRHAQLAAEATQLFRAAGDPAGEVNALQFRGIAHWAADELALADDVFSRSLDLATSLSWAGGRAAALVCLAIVRHYGTRNEASRLVESAEAILADAPAHDVVPPMLDAGESLRNDGPTGVQRLVFEQTFAPFRQMTPREAHGHVLLSRSRLARQAADPVAAWDLCHRALDLFREIDDQRGQADAHASIGALAAELGDLDAARASCQRALEVRRHLGDFRGAALAEANLGDVESQAGRYSDARSILASALDSFQRHGDAWGTAATLGNLAILALRGGDTFGARRHLETSLVASRSTGRKRWVGWTLLQLAALAESRLDRNSRAREALAIFQVIGDAPGATTAQELVSAQRSRYVAAKVAQSTSHRSHRRRPTTRRPN
jgi:predicted ATPase/two-component SAPR family response regulator